MGKKSKNDDEDRDKDEDKVRILYPSCSVCHGNVDQYCARCQRSYCACRSAEHNH